MSNNTFSKNNYQQLLVVPAAQGSVSSSWVLPFNGEASGVRAVFEVWVGALSDTFNFKLRRATNSAGANAEDIPGAAITALGASTDEVIVTIEISPGALITTNTALEFKYVQAVITVGSGTPVWGLKLLKHFLRYPGNFDQHSSYSQALEILDGTL
jgi:hypothetical protein